MSHSLACVFMLISQCIYKQLFYLPKRRKQWLILPLKPVGVPCIKTCSAHFSADCVDPTPWMCPASFHHSPGVEYLCFFLTVLYHSNSRITGLDVFVSKPSCAFFPVSSGWILINSSSESSCAHFLVPGATLTSDRLPATSSAESKVLLSLAPSQILVC